METVPYSKRFNCESYFLTRTSLWLTLWTSADIDYSLRTGSSVRFTSDISLKVIEGVFSHAKAKLVSIENNTLQNLWINQLGLPLREAWDVLFQFTSNLNNRPACTQNIKPVAFHDILL